MFKIQDGRDSFTQWDYDRKLIVEDDTITQVHFTNLITNKALVCEVKNNLVDVPNILLQDYGYIVAYGFDENYTKYTVVFKIIRRDKPDDYIYTETEILNYNTLLDKINAVDEGIEQTIEDYLKENPPTVDLDGYATEEYVDNAVSAIDIPEADLTNYYNKQETDNKFATKNEIPSTSGLATEQFVNSKVSGLATENYVDQKVAEIDIPEVDLTGYAKETYVNEVAQDCMDSIDRDYALKTEIPDTSGFLTQVPAEYITETELESKGYLTEHQSLAGYATEDYVDTAISNIPSSGGGSGSVAIDNKTIIKNADGAISTAIGGSREKISEGTIVVSYNDTVGFTNSHADYVRINLPNFNNPKYFNSSILYNFEIDIRNADGSVIDKLSGYMEYKDSYTELLRGNNKLSNADITITEYNPREGYFTYTGSGDFFENFYITKVKIATPDKYSYNKIDSNYINVGNSLVVDGDGKLETLISNLAGDSVNNTILQTTNSTYSGSNNSASFGMNNTVGGQGSISLGRDNKQYMSAAMQISIGDNNTNGYYCTYAFGEGNKVGLNGNKSYTMALGYNLKNYSPYSVVIGRNNIEDTSSTYALIAGIGQDTPTNGLTLDWSGNGAFAGQVSSTGSDYAEYFEWADGNPQGEDRVGYLVALDGDKIRLATPEDEILGIISGTVAVLGDNYEWQWQGKYLTDNFGRVIYDMIDKYEEYEGEQVYIGTFPQPRLNPNWDETATYIPRAKRKEWDAVGLLGKLFVRDDGTCQPNDYIKVGENGIATVSAEKTNMRVMSRKTNNIVRVYVK